ncbi:MAG: ABC transporter ATP-binding protein [Planctomycetes bacterium]|nr:ABC transporter ATP-binding protein [Planctomycetota bacterium]
MLLSLEKVTKSYGAGEHAIEVLHGLDLAVETGEFLAIVGPSGSGKSTLLNLLGALDRPTSGSYLFKGEDIAKFDDKRLSRLRNDQIGFVFQSFQLVSHLTVLENVELPLFYARVPRRQRHIRCKELIERVGLSHRLEHLPSELSGGECQRVAIARALSNEPDLILADEPTGNLDTKTGTEVMQLFHDLHAAGRTIVMITHDPEIARQAPRRVRILDGLITSILSARLPAMASGPEESEAPPSDAPQSGAP